MLFRSTQALVVHVTRTGGVPFVQSRASWPLMLATAGVMAVAAWLPTSPLAGPLGLVPLPSWFWPWLAATLAGYLALTHAAKSWLLRDAWK